MLAVMDVRLLYFDGCPNWTVAHDRLTQAVALVGLDATHVQTEKIETPDQAQAHRFTGSPTILINGNDPSSAVDSPVGMACRRFRTAEGVEGSPSIRQLVEALGS